METYEFNTRSYIDGFNVVIKVGCSRAIILEVWGKVHDVWKIMIAHNLLIKNRKKSKYITFLSKWKEGFIKHFIRLMEEQQHYFSLAVRNQGLLHVRFGASDESLQSIHANQNDTLRLNLNFPF